MRPAQHAHAVFARMRDHGPPNPQFLSTSITKIDGSCSSSSDWRITTARQACVRSFKTHLLDLFFGLYVPTCTDGARQVRVACAKPQTSREVDQDPEGGLTRQCNTRPSFLIMCCLRESLSQDDIPQFLLLLPQAARDRLALCHLSRQDTSRGVPSQGRHRSKVCACRR